MYFATYIFNGVEEVGILDKSKNSIMPLRDIFLLLNEDMSKKLEIPKDLNEFILMSNDALIEEIRKTIEISDIKKIAVSDVKICAPIPYPKRNIFCLGKNYIDHAKEIVGLVGSTDEIPKFPIYFSKIANPAIGDGDIIKNHAEITDMIDYEVELAVIIGKDGIDIKKEDALDYIFGYTIVNDVSARNLQRKHAQWFKGKILDTFCPMGPYLVYKSAIDFPVKLDISCKINDELRQNSNTENLIFDIPYIINDLSKGMMLKSGDIIITGTPSGVGLGFKPFKFLKSGDVIECNIEKIGTLINKIE